MSRIVTSAFWLLLAHVGGLLIPLIELPVLARALGPKEYGLVLYALGVALTASVFVEFGFGLSGARAVAQLKEDKSELGQLVADLFLSKLLLLGLVLLAVAPLFIFQLGGTSFPVSWGVWISIFIFSFGFSPMWYFIGSERLVLVSIFDIVLRVAGLVAVILFVSEPEHSERVLWIQATVGALNTLVPTLLMIRETGFGKLELGRALLAIKISWNLFLYKGSQNIMGSLASTLLGALGGPRMVGAFVPAEKLVRAANGLAGTLLNLIFPRLVLMQNNSQGDAKRKVSLIILSLTALTLTFCVITVSLAPLLVSFIFGKGYEEAVPVLKILVWVVPLRVLSMTLAILWYIPAGQDRITSRGMILNVFTIVSLAFLLVPQFGGAGMAWAFIIAEMLMSSILITMFIRKSV
ncbi:oligosaccharide flippase family protein [Oceanimonas pelagia]|uniref:Oligosaccharide flippase family protein n=1 Tax=Oceanimonas pelagia TaxID=3028314 RepID=A0AA50KQP3_9GAMM|nr:oligosaccharide flippase family protein [Oceanimonas pelagia]WMC11511.1 oligosaccharide flippase family protein [Oceanimonas pelagia]